MKNPSFAVLLLTAVICIVLPHFLGGLAVATRTKDGLEQWGNFTEVGPLDDSLKQRNSTWLKKADLLFVDTPVGTGFSFVEDKELLVKTDEEAARDLTTLLIKVFNKNRTLQKSPLYIVSQSYGGKHAVTVGLSVVRAIKARKLKLKLGGIALGNGWISPIDFVAIWAPLLKDLSRIDNSGLKKSERWAKQSDLVFKSLSGDFMNPVINEVDELLNAGVHVTVYSGQTDLICATKGTEAWVKKLKWKGLKTFLDIDRTPMYCEDDKETKAFTKSYKNFHFYWILKAGHFVPTDQPCVALDMVGNITRSPAR
ncbi:hypothetical protein L1987_34634 [Smallanthus sonchifolius]|uniref:Uncharacterized protein n=1 Tax=Smallanthus sonchifolius TaxID=185202 RepID=A0ACB9HV42_9ASTR|nr:hypothetical protein L1987_34634 [Smallanthus sonchifolius]